MVEVRVADDEATTGAVRQNQKVCHAAFVAKRREASTDWMNE
jgi:hypothetical protein